MQHLSFFLWRLLCQIRSITSPKLRPYLMPIIRSQLLPGDSATRQLFDFHAANYRHWAFTSCPVMDDLGREAETLGKRRNSSREITGVTYGLKI